LKKIVFLIIASLLVIGLVLPGCGGGAAGRPKIIIGVPYPQGDIQGDSMLRGAQMAATEINAAGGVNITPAGQNSTYYDIQIVGRADNEIYDPPNAWNTVNYLVTVSHAQFIIGGFRTEAVIPMILNVFATLNSSNQVPFFICGSATGDLLADIGLLLTPPVGGYPNGRGTPYWSYCATTSDFYKYIFRTTPFNSGFLLGMVFPVFLQLAQDIQKAMNWTWNFTGTGTWPHKVKVAIVAENLTWAEPIIAGYQKLVGGYGGIFGCTLNITETFSDTASQGVVDAALGRILAAQNEIILTCMSGPCGVTFGQEMSALNITAIPVGINVEAQGPNYAIQAKGTNSTWEIATGTYATGVNNTPKTAKFITDYQTFTGSFPIYTAASYDQVYALKEAIEAVDSLDKNLICPYLVTAPSRTTTSAVVKYFPEWDQVTHNQSSKSYLDLPALNLSQVDTLYGPTGSGYGYDAAYNFTMYPFTSHDIVFGPGYSTGICTQWVNGTPVGVWPNPGYDRVLGASYAGYGPIQTFLNRILTGLNWSNTLTYPGIQNLTIPYPYMTVWTGW
jgi:branched-chain amino acid transport system substrate-binding protein